jgi:hypothetical protein
MRRLATPLAIAVLVAGLAATTSALGRSAPRGKASVDPKVVRQSRLTADRRSGSFSASKRT